MRRRHALALLTLLCGALGGCGSASTGSASTHTVAPAPAYTAAGNAICARELTRLHGLAQPSTPEQAIGYLPRALAIMHSETDSLAALDQPATGSDAQLEAALDGTRELAGTLAAFLRQLRSGMIDLTAFAAVQGKSIALREALDRHFRLAGLASCAAT
jgi:hypothetical protein